MNAPALTQTCSKCGQSKSPRDFRRRHKTNTVCRECERAGAVEWVRAKSERKPCALCRKRRPLYKFTVDERSEDGHGSVCAQCRGKSSVYRAHIMTEDLYRDMLCVYGSCACYVCSRPINIGDHWCWYVGGNLQRHEEQDGGFEPAFGCLEHKGMVIEVLGGLYQIGPVGQAARRVG